MKKIFYIFLLLLLGGVFQQNFANTSFFKKNDEFSGDELKEIYNKKYSVFFKKLKNKFIFSLKNKGLTWSSYKNLLLEYKLDRDYIDDEYIVLTEHFYGLMKLMETNFKENEKDQAYYQQFLKILRMALGNSYFQKYGLDSEKNKQPDNILWGFKKIIEIMYTEITLFDYKDSLVRTISKTEEKLIQKEVIENFDSKHIYKLLEESLKNQKRIYEKLNQNGNIEKNINQKLWKKLKDLARSSMFNSFDPALEGNVTSVKMILYSNKYSKKIPNLRMGTPTIGNSNSVGDEVALTPEFLTFLKYRNVKNKKHLYINYQVRRTELKRSFGVANEVPRVKVLEQKGNNLNNLAVISLDKDSSFYHQSGSNGAAKMNSKAFIKDYTNKLLSKDDNAIYHFPDKLTKNSNFIKDITGILNFIWINFFKQAPILSCDERKIFIDLSYILIPQFLLKDYDSYNRTCKDGIDRAGSENALEFTILLLMSLQNNPINFAKHIKYYERILFTDALFARHRGIKKGRCDRYLSTSLWVIKSFKNDPELSNKWRDISGIGDFAFSSMSNID